MRPLTVCVPFHTRLAPQNQWRAQELCPSKSEVEIPLLVPYARLCYHTPWTVRVGGEFVIRMWIIVILATWFLPCSAHAARIVSVGSDRGVTLFSVQGRIAQGDADQFIAAISSAQKAVIFLESDGGNLSEALRLGSYLNGRGFSTAVLPGKICASACALLWLSGNNKYFSEGSKIGFHAAYYQRDGISIESGLANARIGAYLTELRYSLDLVEFVTAASPNEITWLDKKSATMIGLQFIDLDILDSPTSQSEPIPTDFKSSVSAASKMTKSVKNTGAAGLRADVEICYEALTHKSTLKDLASCYIADQASCDLEAAAGQHFGIPLPESCMEKAIASRVNPLFEKLRIPAAKRKSLTNLWRSLSKSVSFE